MSRQRKFDKSIFLLVIIVAVLGGTVLFLVLHFRSDELSETLKQGKPFAAAFMVSEGESLMFTEVVFYDPVTSKAAILDVPGEVGSIIESMKRIDRIDVLYRKGKPQQFLKKVESIVDYPIRYYFEMDLDGVRRLTDLLEGIEMFIANPVEIVTREKIVLLPSGSIVLDGDKTAEYVTFEDEDDDSDLDRIGRKQKFVQAVLERIGKMRSYLEKEDVFAYLLTCFNTNMERKAVMSFVKEMQKLDVERIVFQRVLGALRDVDSQKLLFPHYDGKLLKETIKQTMETLSNTEVTDSGELTVTLEILNGTNVTGLASRTSQVFQSFGFEIALIGNAENDGVQSTVVYYRGPDPAKARKAADLIRCTQIMPLPEGGVPRKQATAGERPEADVVLLLGSDFDGRYCKE